MLPVTAASKRLPALLPCLYLCLVVSTYSTSVSSGECSSSASCLDDSMSALQVTMTTKRSDSTLDGHEKDKDQKTTACAGKGCPYADAEPVVTGTDVAQEPVAIVPVGEIPVEEVVPEVTVANETHHGDCTPKCRWKCEEVQCDEVCEPECEAPQCETRCSTAEVQGCTMECGAPQCTVLCPERGCPLEGCARCTTSCSPAQCKLTCPQDQPCQNVCQEPSCQWKCHAPTECPAPKCHMLCETPTPCMNSATVKELPPLVDGEIAVKAFQALPGEKVSLMSVKATVGGSEHIHLQVPVTHLDS